MNNVERASDKMPLFNISRGFGGARLKGGGGGSSFNLRGGNLQARRTASLHVAPSASPVQRHTHTR